MEQIVKTYVKTFILLVVCISIVQLMFQVRDSNGNIGILKMLGSKITQTSQNTNSTNAEYGVIKTEAVKQRPSVVYDTNQYIHAKTDIRLTDYIIVKDYSNKQMNYTLEKIIGDASGTAVNTANINDIVFPLAGKYTVTIVVSDDTGRKETCTIHVPVLR